MRQNLAQHCFLICRVFANLRLYCPHRSAPDSLSCKPANLKLLLVTSPVTQLTEGNNVRRSLGLGLSGDGEFRDILKYTMNLELSCNKTNYM